MSVNIYPIMPDLVIAHKYINKAKHAEEKGHDFSLTLPEFTKLMKRRTCFYTGVPLQHANLTYPDGRTIDRIDSSKGYTKDNVVACSYYFNQTKAVFEDTNSSVTLKAIIKGLSKL